MLLQMIQDTCTSKNTKETRCKYLAKADSQHRNSKHFVTGKALCSHIISHTTQSQITQQASSFVNHVNICTETAQYQTAFLPQTCRMSSSCSLNNLRAEFSYHRHCMLKLTKHNDTTVAKWTRASIM